MSHPRRDAVTNQWLEGALARSRKEVRAPRGFTSRVMDVVYREALVARTAPAQTGPAARTASLMYRRIALSFMLTAAVLTASLLIPSGPYTRLIASAGNGAAIGAGPSTAVKGALRGAAAAVQGALGERQIGGVQP